MLGLVLPFSNGVDFIEMVDSTVISIKKIKIKMYAHIYTRYAQIYKDMHNLQGFGSTRVYRWVSTSKFEFHNFASWVSTAT